MSTDLLRAYEPEECGKDGYPTAWHEVIKFRIREEAGFRCIRCLHPYTPGAHGSGEWSPCDERCQHEGPLRSIGGGVVKTVITPSDRPGTRIEAQWRILTVHHLDGEKRNCRWWNLAALCQRCHLIIQGRVRMGQLYPFEHSDWFKPFAAGYYAHVYLGEDLTRAEAEERQDELLALERAI